MKELNYKIPRYWYHLSANYKKNGVFLFKPWDNKKAIHRDYREPNGKRIPVAPTIPQCLTALPVMLDKTYRIYRTLEKVKAEPPEGVFDSDYTHEGWILKDTVFVLVGKLDLDDVPTSTIENSACNSSGDLHMVRRDLNRWKRKNIRQYIDYNPEFLKLYQ